MNISRKLLSLFFVGIILSIITSELIGGWYFQIFRIPRGGIGPSFACDECLDGFFLGYSFFITFLLIVFGGEKKYKHTGIAIGTLFLLLAAFGAYQNLIISFGAAAVGFLLAQLVLLIKRGVRKNIE